MSASNHARSRDATLRARSRELLDEGKARARKLGLRVRGQMRDRPVTSLVVAGSMGLLVGLMLGRKRWR